MLSPPALVVHSLYALVLLSVFLSPEDVHAIPFGEEAMPESHVSPEDVWIEGNKEHGVQGLWLCPENAKCRYDVNIETNAAGFTKSHTSPPGVHSKTPSTSFILDVSHIGPSSKTSPDGGAAAVMRFSFIDMQKTKVRSGDNFELKSIDNRNPVTTHQTPDAHSRKVLEDLKRHSVYVQQGNDGACTR